MWSLVGLKLCESYQLLNPHLPTTNLKPQTSNALYRNRHQNNPSSRLADFLQELTSAGLYYVLHVGLAPNFANSNDQTFPWRYLTETEVAKKPR
jgi:hypothetical protein